MIKTTTLEYYAPMSNFVVFREYVAENGASLCTIGNRIVTREEGNLEFLNIVKRAKHYVTKKTTIDASDKEILERLNGNIDRYVEYIDDYRQYKATCVANDEIHKVIHAFKAIAGITR